MHVYIYIFIYVCTDLFMAHEVGYQPRNKNSSYFAEWIPNNIKASVCDAWKRDQGSTPEFTIMV